MTTDRFFELSVSYGQIAFFDPDLTNPFNDWTKRHVAQGFSWRQESVSFATFQDGGRLHVAVREDSQITLRHDTLRAIVVPFTVSPTGKVEATSISSNGRIIDIPPGRYALVFEHGVDASDTMWCRLTFVAQESVEAAVLRADPELNPRVPLLLDAQPA
jgi:hypothetical protein